MECVDVGKLFINAKKSRPISACVPSIRSSLTIGGFSRFQGIEVGKETLNHGFMAGYEEEYNAFARFIMNQINNNALNANNVGGTFGNIASTVVEFRMSK